MVEKYFIGKNKIFGVTEKINKSLPEKQQWVTFLGKISSTYTWHVSSIESEDLIQAKIWLR